MKQELFPYLFTVLVCHGMRKLCAHVAAYVRRQASLSLLEVVQYLVDRLHLVASQVALHLRHLERLKTRQKEMNIEFKENIEQEGQGYESIKT